MLIPNPDDLTNKVSNRTRKIFGFLSLFISIGVVSLSFISNDSTAMILSLIAGVPLFLLGCSLLFGRGKKGKGIFSPFTLYLIGTVIGVASVITVLMGYMPSSVGFAIAFGCYALAKKRSYGAK
ncbi:hypothetical protein AAEU32_12450 [Pseudoalteromonas sp. SSDWG2]|uniref:hypothetical protein n=1 Tax=Pseudoalteromonas sp. SSDWG2 TaxID=3139391 RepID=UPI003BAC7CEA